MDDDAEGDKAIADAKASLKEIMDGLPHPEEEKSGRLGSNG